jgi:hypothetical protein
VICAAHLSIQSILDSLVPAAGSQSMSRLRKELEVFLRCSRSMQVLMVSNMIYALVLPVIEVFVAAYVMRNSHAVAKVVTYQLSIYAATPHSLLSERQAPGPHWRQASVRRRNGAVGCGHDADDATEHPDAGRRCHFGIHHGAGHRHLLGQPRIPGPDRHQRRQPQLLLWIGKFCCHFGRRS